MIHTNIYLPFSENHQNQPSSSMPSPEPPPLQSCMHYLTRSFLPRVYRVRVEGNITAAMTQTIARGLQAWPFYPTALLVTINSPGGSVSQAKAISDLLRLYSNRYNVPVITFAEDACLGSANIVLTSGVKSYASSFSMIGDLGHYWSKLWFDRLAAQYRITQDSVTANPNTISANPLEPLDSNSETWLKNYGYALEHDLKSAVLANRGAALQRKGLSAKDAQAKILGAGLLSPADLVSSGYLDGIKSFDQEIKQRFGQWKIRQIKHKGTQIPLLRY